MLRDLIYSLFLIHLALHYILYLPSLCSLLSLDEEWLYLLGLVLVFLGHGLLRRAWLVPLLLPVYLLLYLLWNYTWLFDWVPFCYIGGIHAFL